MGSACPHSCPSASHHERSHTTPAPSSSSTSPPAPRCGAYGPALGVSTADFDGDDPSKDLVRQFMTKWRGTPAVQGEESYRQVTSALADIGDFYRRNGARARMSAEVGDGIMAKLAAAEEALPPQTEKPSLFPF